MSVKAPAAIYAKLRHIHRVNRILWASILGGMLVLGLVGFLFHYMKLIQWQAFIMQKVDQILFFTAIALLLLVFYIKRHYLQIPKLIQRAKVRPVNLAAGDAADLMEEFDANASLLVKTLMLMRRYYMVIWSIANLILIIGFIYFILSGLYKTFLLYLLIGLYVMLTNFPFFSLLERCYIRIYDQPLEQNMENK